MNRNRIWIIIAAAIMLCVIGGLSVMSVKVAKDNGYSNTDFAFSFGGKAELRNTIELPLSQMEDLGVTYGSKSLNIYPGEGDKVIIKEYLCSDSPLALAKVEDSGNGRVTVTGGQNTFILFGFWGIGERIEIYLPEAGLSKLSLCTGSGKICKERDFPLQLESFRATAGSGKIKWQGVTAQQSEFAAGSGKIDLQDISGSVSAKTGSGSISIQGVEGEVTASAGSGAISVKDLRGGGRFSAGSGSVRVEAAQVTQDLNIETKSGSSHLELPEALSFTAELQVGSGGIHTYFEDVLSYNKRGSHATGQVGNDPACSVYVKAGSGSIYIKED